jgi:tRNA(Ile)-lysidine synthase
MSHRGPNDIIRPLLDFTREQIVSHALHECIGHSEDSTNLDTALARNLIRREIIPAMQRINPSVSAAISRLADIAREEGEVVDIMSRILEIDARVVDWGIVKVFRLEDIESSPLQSRSASSSGRSRQ